MRAIKSSSNAESKTKSTQNRPFDAQAFLDSAGVARKPKEFKKAEVVPSCPVLASLIGEREETASILRAGSLCQNGQLTALGHAPAARAIHG